MTVGGISGVAGYFPYCRKRGSMKLGEWVSEPGEKGVLIEKVWSKKPNISLLGLAGWVTNTLLFRTFCPFFQLLLPGLSGVQLASEGQLCAAV